VILLPRIATMGSRVVTFWIATIVIAALCPQSTSASVTDEVLTTPDEVSELKSKNAAQSMQIASLNEQVAKLTKTSSTSNLDEAELGEWLRAGRGGHLAPNADGVLAAEEAIQRKAQGRRPDPKATDKLKSASEAKTAAANNQTHLVAAKFTKLTPNGYCADYLYPKTGIRSGGYDNVSTTAAQCHTRCVAQDGVPLSFYLKGTQCGCSAGKTGACSVKARAGFTSYEITLTKAQKIAADACDYHPGLAAKSWVEPYRKAVLDSSLRNIMHNEVRVDCNPASCDNPSVCGIPPCRGVPHTKNGRWNPDYKKAVTKKKCPAAKGCGAQTAAVSSDMPSKPKWAYLSMTQPATRVGVVYPTTYNPGVVTCYPKFTKTDKYGNIGSWMWPGAGNCNPYQLMVCNKGSIAHTALPTQRDGSHLHSALLFVKRTWCIKGECDSSDCPARCYASKSGQCLRFHKPVMPNYQEHASHKHSQKAYKELVAGRFSTKCTPEAAQAARAMLAGN